MKALINFLKSETVFCVSFFLALASALIVRPDSFYLAYPDYRTVALLFCLMLIVAGFRSLGVFDFMGRSLLKRAGSLRRLSVTMVLLCFWSSMVITNDVTLITFVPFTILVFRMVGEEERILKVVVLETIAANLGSMATPIGNPQNLYLYSAFSMDMEEFAWAVLPYAGISLVLLLFILWKEPDKPIQKNVGEESAAGDDPVPKKEKVGAKAPVPGTMTQKKAPLQVLDMRPVKRRANAPVPTFSVYMTLLLLCLLVVFRILPYGPVLIITVLVAAVVNPRLLKNVDYFLLLTFLCFFVFIGNMKRVPQVNDLLVALVGGRELWAGILASQIISNVPAAILLSGFTDNAQALLTGVNLGGLGTLIASLASLISFKFYAGEFPERKGRYMKVFTFWNLVFLGILICAAVPLFSNFNLSLMG